MHAENYRKLSFRYLLFSSNKLDYWCSGNHRTHFHETGIVMAQQQSERSVTVRSEHRVNVAGNKEELFVTLIFDGDGYEPSVELSQIDITPDDIEFVIAALLDAKAEIEWRKTRAK